jgi:hypothetical protein
VGGAAFFPKGNISPKENENLVYSAHAGESLPQRAGDKPQGPLKKKPVRPSFDFLHRQIVTFCIGTGFGTYREK